jgi:sec-independent protein translocase protein TatA
VIFNDLLAPTHLLLILVVALVVLGPKRLPGAARSLGRGMREFKDSLGGVMDDERERKSSPPAKTPDRDAG